MEPVSTSEIDVFFPPNSTGAKLKLARVRVTEAEIPTLYKQLDKNGDGSIDRDELRFFLQGRYNMTVESADKVFTLFDNDKNNTIDKDEFAKIIHKSNELVAKFDEDEIKHLTSSGVKIICCSYFGYCCCLCTVSCFLINKYIYISLFTS